MLDATTTTPDTTITERLTALEMAVHRLTGVVQSRLAPPVTLLTIREAAERARKCEKTVRSWVQAGYLTDRRSGRGKGSHHLVAADELEILLSDGVDAARRYRSRMGRE